MRFGAFDVLLIRANLCVWAWWVSPCESLRSQTSNGGAASSQKDRERDRGRNNVLEIERKRA